MSLSNIEAFVQTAEHRSFRRAAEALGISAGAVSKSVARLEEEIGCPLFNRTTRSVALTAEGEMYVEHCRLALAQLRVGRDLVSESSTIAKGRLKVSIPFVVGRLLVARLHRLQERHPRLSLDIALSDRETNFVSDGTDVAVRLGRLEDSSLLARKLRTPRWVTLASPSYLARHGAPRTPEDLGCHRGLKFRRPGGTIAEWQFRGADGDAREVATSSSLSLDQGDLLLDAAMHGLGLCQVFDFMAADAVQRGVLVEVLPDFAVDGPVMHALCIRRRAKTPRIRAFLDFLVENLGAAPGP